MEYIFLSYKSGSGHTFDSLLKKWIMNPLKFGERVSKIALNGYNRKIRLITEKEKESFNRAFKNENFVNEALKLKMYYCSDTLKNYYKVRNYSMGIKDLKYIDKENGRNIYENISYVNRKKWMDFFKATTENDLSFMFYVNVGKIKNNNWNDDSEIYRHNCKMPEPYEKIRKKSIDQLAKFLELCVEKRIQIDDTPITYYDLFYSTDIKLLSKLIIDTIIWNMYNWKPLYTEFVGWELSKYFTKFVQNRYEIEIGKIPFLFEVSKHYYQNYYLKNSNETYSEFYQKIANQIAIKDKNNKENIFYNNQDLLYLPLTTGLRISNTILRRIVGNNMRYKNIQIYERGMNIFDKKYKNDKLSYIQLTQKLKNYLNEELKNEFELETFVPFYKMPLLFPILPYINPLTTNGIMYSKNLPISNVYEPKLTKRLIEKSKNYPELKYIESLNILNNIAMNFDKEIYKAIEKMNKSGKKFPRLDGNLNTMTSNEVIKLFEPENQIQANDAEFLQNSLNMAKRYLKIINSKISSLEYTKKSLKIISEFGFKTPFYLSYQCDYRGRYFPKNYVHHHTNDVIRSLFRFNEYKIINNDGINALKIHLYVTKYGRDKTGKLTKNDYINYIDNNLQNILDSANNYENCNWWRETNPEKCWQILSICIEIRNYYKNPNNYKSSYPVKIDIAATLITHLSLLLKDENLAKMSSLSKIFPNNSLIDIYQYFTYKVKENFSEIQNQNLDLFNTLYPQIVENKLFSPSRLKPLILKSILSPSINRHNPYLTLHEMNNFIKENPQFINLSRNVFNELDLLVNKTSFNEAFSTLTSFKSWLWDMAENICNDGRFASWYSPSGLHVMPIFVNKFFHISKFDWITGSKDIEDCVDIYKQGMSPKKIKYINSFLPNIIDSLDSALFTNVIKSCKKENITVMGVHDSYWTHASDVKRLQQIIKEELYLMYKEPILERIYEDLNENLSNKCKYKVPYFKHVGKLDMELLKTSKEFVCY